MKPQIVSDPQVLSGKPVIAGTRISVELILDKVTSGMSTDEILTDYPHLTSQQIEAALSYAKQLVRRPAPKQTASVTLYTHEISRR